MLILNSNWGPTSRHYARLGRVGRLVTPRTRTNYRRLGEEGGIWAADNDCFQGFDEAAYRRMLRRIAGWPGCRFVTAPDVIANSTETLRWFDDWEPLLRSYRLPVALVAQDGLIGSEVPWDRLQALFIGGSTAWKLSLEAELLVRSAKERGVWVHMGRVNTDRRLRYAVSLGCDSVDGTAYSRWCNTYLPRAIRVAQVEQLRLSLIPPQKHS